MSTLRIFQNAAKFSAAVTRMAGSNNVNNKLIKIPQQQAVAWISTSKKNRDTTITADSHTVSPPKTVEDFANPKEEHYQSYGFYDNDREMDINTKNSTMFFTVTIAFVGCSFIMMYFPDIRMRDWNQREAFIELARREALGLPLIDPNLVPADQVELPSEEELGDFDIII